MFQLAAFAESIDPGATLVNVAAVPDDTVFVSGDDMRVPRALPYLLGEAALISATLPVQAQVQSPSLRQVANIDVFPIGTGVEFGSPEDMILHQQSPIPMRADEAANFLVNSDPGGAVAHYGLLWFGDGPQQRVNGNIYTVRVTVAATLSAVVWVNASLTFAQDLPVGNYDVVGMQGYGSGLVAARLNFVGGAWRPGIPCGASITDNIGHQFRSGKMGVFGTFHTNTPPTVDCLGATGTSQTFYLDLLYKG